MRFPKAAWYASPLFRVFHDPDNPGGVNADPGQGGGAPAQPVQAAADPAAAAAPPSGGDPPADDWKARYDALLGDVQAGRHESVTRAAERLVSDIVPGWTGQTPQAAPQPQAGFQGRQAPGPEPDGEDDPLAVEVRRLQEADAYRTEREYDQFIAGLKQRFPRMNEHDFEASVDTLLRRGAHPAQINYDRLAQLSHDSETTRLNTYTGERVSERVANLRKALEAPDADLAAIVKAASDPTDRAIAELVQSGVKLVTDRLRAAPAAPPVPTGHAGVPTNAPANPENPARGLTGFLRAQGWR
jgi:hypothetical protein